MNHQDEDWPEATRSLLEAPQLARIERHGEKLLSQALNGGRVIAFVGSGASMAYGRVSWRDLVRLNQKRVLSKVPVPKKDLDSSRVGQMRTLLETHKIADSGESVGGDFTQVFQLTEQLARLALKDDRPGFRDHVAHMVRDDRGHLRAIIAEVIDLERYRDGTSNRPELALDLDAEDDASREAWAAVRHRAFAEVLVDWASQDPDHNHIVQTVAALLPPVGPLWPYHRFVLALLLALIPEDRRALAYEHAIRQARQEIKEQGAPLVPLERGALVPRERDPLRLLLDLQIRRFLTTNYDSEIERLLRSEGYAHAVDEEEEPPAEDGPSRPDDPLAAASEDLVFDADHTGHLFAFVAHTPKREGAVVHLHGLADRDEDLIVTEEDYQQRYLAEGPKRSLVEDSMRAAFASSPLLFIGSGMSEDDLVRPLRQFVHDPTVGAGRLAIALLPALKSRAKLEADAIRFLQRYGVYTVYFGAEPKVDGPTKGSESKEYGWLEALKEYIRVLGKDIGKEKLLDIRRIENPSSLEGIEVTAHPALSIAHEIDLLNQLPALVAGCSSNDERMAAALRVLIQGIEDSITGALLCARLLRVVRDWGRWRDGWLALPEPEGVERAVRLPDVTKSEGIFRRHHVRLPNADDIKSAHQSILASAPMTPDDTRRNHRLLRQRFDARSYSPTFSAFIAALKQYRLPDQGRRIFLLVTHRGVGKGHFAAGLGESDYLKMVRVALNGKVGPTAHFNLSFSHEVSSTFDQLAEWLLVWLGKMEEALKHPNPTGAAACKALADRAAPLARDRVGRLEVLLKGLHTLASTGLWPTDHRLLVVFNRFSVLFDSDGDPKNAQIARIFRLLVAPETAAAPLDLMLICSDATLPRHFRPGGIPATRAQQPPPLAFLPIHPQGLNEAQRRELERREASVNVDRTASRNFVHFLQPARASLLAVSYFPSVALAIARQMSAPDGGTAHVAPEDLPTLFAPGTAYTLRMTIRDQLHGNPDAQPYARDALPIILAAAAHMVPEQDGWARLLPIAAHLPPDYARMTREDIRKFHLHEVAKALNDRGEIINVATLNTISGNIDTYFKDLFEACGGGRFALTLLLACAYHLLLPAAEWDPKKGTPNSGEMERAFRAAIDFLERMRRTLAGLPRPRRDDMILERVLEAYRRIHETPGYPLPGGLAHITWGVKLFDLMQQILWHLAVIGQPVVTEVLAEAPDIAKAAKAAAKGGAATLDVVLDAMVLLEARCLVFEIHSSHLTTNEPGPNGQTRWAVHRLVQRHVFLTMRAPFVDYGDTDQFALTLYASQPNDVPRLALASRDRLMSLLSGLTAYPEPPVMVIEESAWNQPNDNFSDLRRRSQMLRAALGVLRSSLSLTTLLRLDLQEAGAAGLARSFGPLSRGVLDEHRLMLRWLLRQSGMVKPTKKDGQGFQRPLYAEQIVWLHNEVATVALLQGRMMEAVAHYNRADEAARRHLEPADSGALRVRVALNRAYADIGRGRMGLAAAAARKIIAIPDEHKAIGPIAHGVLALVQHIRGRFEEAEREYGLALDGGAGVPGLLALNRSRAAALSSKSYGDMLRAQSRWEDARQRLKQAYTLALEGNYEDVRHLVVLSQIRLDMRDASENRPAPLAGREQHRRLDDAEGYARSMAIPQLQCEVLQLRASLHIDDGDLKTAASAAGAGLSIATANDLQLRSTGFLLLLSDIYLRRELYREARPLLVAAQRMARDVHPWDVTGFG